MGQEVSGNILDAKQLEKYADAIRERYIGSLKSHFSGLQPVRNGKGIQTIGNEIELQFTSEDGQPAPAFDYLKASLGKDFAGEVLTNHGEVQHDSNQLFTLYSSLDNVLEGLHSLLLPVYSAARDIDTNISLISGHPSFNPEMGLAMFSNQLRHITKRNQLSHLAKPVIIQYADGSSELLSGNVLQGFTSMQNNTKVPHYMAGYYHDAANILGPLFLAASASSPFLDDRLTGYDSVRSLILPAINHGFPDEGRPGRWRTLKPLNGNDYPAHFDHDLEALISGYNQDLAASARYFGTIAKDGHVIVSEDDLYGSSKDFPKPTTWPWVQLQTGNLSEDNTILDNKGIVVEGRYGEMPGTVEDIAAYSLTWAAALEGLAREMYKSKTRPLSADQVQYNLEQCSLRSPTPTKQIYWPNGNNIKVGNLQDCYRHIGRFAVDTLRSYGHEEQEIQDIVNPVLTRAGIAYVNDKFYSLGTPNPTPAETMRNIAYQMQPSIIDGAELHQDTTAAITNHFKYQGTGKR